MHVVVEVMNVCVARLSLNMPSPHDDVEFPHGTHMTIYNICTICMD